MIYGSITVLALILAFEHGAHGPIPTAAILFGSVFAIVLAESFAKVSSDAVRARRPYRWSDLRNGWNHSRPNLIAANTATLLIALAATDLYDFETGVALARLAAIGFLAVYGYSIGWVIYRGVIPGVLHASFTGGIGALLALVRFALHWPQRQASGRGQTTSTGTLVIDVTLWLTEPSI